VSAGISSVALYAASPCPVDLVAKFAGGNVKFEQINLDSVGELLTYNVSFASGNLPDQVSILDNNVELHGP